MKSLIKNLTPPIVWNEMVYLRNYVFFLKYKNLISKNTELKGIHKGKRCFILGSAPSIKKEGLKPLKNEIVFALNNFYVHEDFAQIISGEKPKYYIIAPIHPPQTEDEWKRWLQDMETHIPEKITMLFGLNYFKKNIKFICDKDKIFQKHKVYWYYGGINVDRDYIFDEKDLDITRMIWDAGSVSTYALIFAIYMGFDKIYLLGIDHNYTCINNEENYRFYKSSIHQINEERRMNYKKSDSFFGTAKVFLEKELISENCDNSKIFNCSSESLLNMFEKVNFNEVVKYNFFTK